MNDKDYENIKVICPIKKEYIPKCCRTCKLVVKNGDNIIGCSIKLIAHTILDNKKISATIKDSIIKFEKDMDNGDR